MNTSGLYLPPIWPDRDPVSETALKAVGFCSSFAVLWAVLSLVGGY